MTDEGNKDGNASAGADNKTVPLAQYQELQSKFDTLYAGHVDLKKQVEAFSKLGDPDTIRGKLEDYTNMKKDKAAGNREEVDRLIQQAREEESNAWKNKVAEFETKYTEAAKRVRHFEIALPTRDAVEKHITAGAADFVIEHIERVADLDGDSVVIKGKDGKPLRSEADPSKPMSLEEYVQKLAKEKPEIAKPKGTSGAGATGTSSASADAGGVTVEAYMQMTPDQRRALPLEVQHKLAPLALKALGKR